MNLILPSIWEQLALLFFGPGFVSPELGHWLE